MRGECTWTRNGTWLRVVAREDELEDGEDVRPPAYIVTLWSFLAPSEVRSQPLRCRRAIPTQCAAHDAAQQVPPSPPGLVRDSHRHLHLTRSAETASSRDMQPPPLPRGIRCCLVNS